MNKLIRWCALLAVTLGLAACGSGSGSNNTSASLDNTYSLLKEGNLQQALVDVDATLKQDPQIDGGDGLLVKSQIQAALGDTGASRDTLKTYDGFFPKGSGDEFLLAEYEAYKGTSGDPQIILKNMMVSLNDNYSGIDEETWWGLVEESSDYQYFRTTPEYLELQALKPPQAAPAKSCKEGKTVFESKWWGTAIYVNHSDMIYYKGAAMLTKLFTKFLPPGYSTLVSLALTARDVYVVSKDKGCGVIVHYTWANWAAIPVMLAVAAEAFWVTSQK